MEVLRRLFGDAIPQPAASVVTKWRSDAYARGGRPLLSLLSRGPCSETHLMIRHHATERLDRDEVRFSLVALCGMQASQTQLSLPYNPACMACECRVVLLCGSGLQRQDIRRPGDPR